MNRSTRISRRPQSHACRDCTPAGPRPLGRVDTAALERELATADITARRVVLAELHERDLGVRCDDN
ncbi:MAG TPA: hypothetical protein VHW26_13495 [Solirubrobacteraceae bacterium]|jgi:hypothetical protein|nr:hypothetical protein [Solirubrobacteraceae bacterium]